MSSICRKRHGALAEACRRLSPDIRARTLVRLEMGSRRASGWEAVHLVSALKAMKCAEAIPMMEYIEGLVDHQAGAAITRSIKQLSTSLKRSDSDKRIADSKSGLDRLSLTSKDDRRLVVHDQAGCFLAVFAEAK